MHVWPSDVTSQLDLHAMCLAQNPGRNSSGIPACCKLLLKQWHHLFRNRTAPVRVDVDTTTLMDVHTPRNVMSAGQRCSDRTSDSTSTPGRSATQGFECLGLSMIFSFNTSNNIPSNADPLPQYIYNHTVGPIRRQSGARLYGTPRVLQDAVPHSQIRSSP